MEPARDKRVVGEVEYPEDHTKNECAVSQEFGHSGDLEELPYDGLSDDRPLPRDRQSPPKRFDVNAMGSLLLDRLAEVNKELWLILSLLTIAALMNYLKDNGMRFQRSWSAMTADPSEREDWTTVTLPYGPDPDIFQCPARQPFPYTLYGNPARGITFPLNYGISVGIQDEIWTKIEDPSKIGAVADAGHDRFYTNEQTWGMPQIRKCRKHRGRAGLLFADWHAELVKDVSVDMFMP